MFAYIHINVYIYIYIYIYIYLYIYIYYMFVHMHINVYIYIYICFCCGRLPSRSSDVVWRFSQDGRVCNGDWSVSDRESDRKASQDYAPINLSVQRVLGSHSLLRTIMRPSTCLYKAFWVRIAYSARSADLGLLPSRKPQVRSLQL